MQSSWSEPKRRVWGWLVPPVLGLVLLIPSFRHRAELVVGAIGAPVTRFIHDWREEDRSAIEQELDRVQTRVAELAVSSAHVAALEEENRLLREQAQVSPDSGFELLGAQVIARQMEPDRAAITIDRGRLDEVEVGQPVLAGGGILIGKIASLGERTATVELLTDPRSRFAASLRGETRLLGVVEGRGNGAARMTYIPASQTIEKNHIVVSAGTEEKIPAHLPLGLVNAVEGKNTDPFVSAILEPLLPLDRVRVVSILRPEHRPR